MYIDSVFQVLDSGPGGDPPYRLIVATADGAQLHPGPVKCPADVLEAAARLHDAAKGPAVYGWGWYAPINGERVSHEAVEDTATVAEWVERVSP